MKIAGKIIKYNSQAFKQMFERLFPVMSMVASRILKDDEKGKDIAQEAFVKLWNHSDEEFVDESALRAYMYVLVKNACISVIRKEKKVKNIKLEDQAIAVYDQEFLNEILRDETYQLLRDAIDCLSPQAAHVVRLTLKGYSNLDISEELGVTINTIKTVKKRAYKALREKLRNQFMVISLFFFTQFM